MVAGTVPIKTAAGHDELGTRQRRLSQRHRTVLFLVDGRRSAARSARVRARRSFSSVSEPASGASARTARARIRRTSATTGSIAPGSPPPEGSHETGPRESSVESVDSEG